MLLCSTKQSSEPRRDIALRTECQRLEPKDGGSLQFYLKTRVSLGNRENVFLERHAPPAGLRFLYHAERMNTSLLGVQAPLQNELTHQSVLA